MNIDINQYQKRINWTEDDAKKFLHEPRIVKMVKLVGTGKTVLDIGCFTGDFAQQLVKNDNVVVGLDSNKQFVKLTQEKNIPAVHANLEQKFPVVDSHFDTVVAGEIIEHIYNTEGFLKECNRVLADDGELIISTPNINWLSFRLQMLFGKTLPFHLLANEGSEFPGHIRYYTVESLQKTLRQFGFEPTLTIGSNITNKKGLELLYLADKWPSIAYHIIIKAKKVRTVA